MRISVFDSLLGYVDHDYQVFKFLMKQNGKGVHYDGAKQHHDGADVRSTKARSGLSDQRYI